jgi:integrase
MRGIDNDSGAMLIKLRYVHKDVDRHGNVRLYFQRKGGPKVRLRHEPGSEAFSKVYHDLLRGTAPIELTKASTIHTAVGGTYGWLCARYLTSPAFKRSAKLTQAVRRRVLEQTCLEPVHPGEPETFASFPLARLSTKFLRVLRDRKSDVPGAANDRVRAIRAAFKWGCKEELLDSNAALALDLLPMPGAGFHSWTIDEVEQFEAAHAIGTKARLAISLLLWTGVRRSDVVRLGRQLRAKSGWLRFTQTKNKDRKPVTTEIPILPELQRVLDTSPLGDPTYLVTDYGHPFTANGFSNWFRKRCREAGLHGCSAHGLRKAGAATAAENGASTHTLMAIFGWLSVTEAERYTRAAERKRLARQGMGLLVKRDAE